MTQFRHGDELAVILISTKWDSKSPAEIQRLFEEGFDGEYTFLVTDGCAIPDITHCLNVGIKTAINLGCKYVHWIHSDFTYENKQWFPVLKQTLDAYPEILKICASNSRDPIGDWRIGQEQTWLMRCADFVKYPWLFFDQNFVRCGGAEDYMQHLNILGRGKLIAITPEATIYHKGAQSRGKYDSNQEAMYNYHIFGQKTGFNQLIEVHTTDYFGLLLPEEERRAALEAVPESVRELLSLRASTLPYIPERLEKMIPVH